MRTRTTDGPVQLATPEELRRWSLRCHAAGMTVGLVPTMGALHEGHFSLLRRALGECDRVVVSIFVTPTQFGPGEDFDRYPRSMASDTTALARLGAHALYVPRVEAMYPPGVATTVQVSGPLADRLEAARRPGHFEGVALVVAKLFIAARPERAYFGAKDAQQCAVVRRLAADLDTGVTVVVCPTARDRDGLAMSSRNVYLDRRERERARAIPRALAVAAEQFEGGERRAAAIVTGVRQRLEAAEIAIDYVALVEPDDCTDVDVAARGCEILVAARIGATRLIDSLRLGIDAAPDSLGGT